MKKAEKTYTDEEFNKIIERSGSYIDKFEQNADHTKNETKKYAKIKRLNQLVKQIYSVYQEFEELKEFEANPGFKDIIISEQRDLELRQKDLEFELYQLIVDDESIDKNNVIIEIRSGTGGDEACLFAYMLFKMYAKYSIRKGWKFEQISLSNSDIGGCREAIGEISGKNVYSLMKHESGTHRVQRVPITESAGRTHTSAATVAIFPQPNDIDIKIDNKDIRIDVFRSSGPGGQSVNKTDSAVRITHEKTGIIAQCQSDRSQRKNKDQAMKVLKARIYEKIQNDQHKKISAIRKMQVGSGDRSERIRTYNFPQLRITDHRIKKTVHNINEAVNEGKIEELQEELQKHEIQSAISAKSIYEYLKSMIDDI